MAARFRELVLTGFVDDSLIDDLVSRAKAGGLKVYSAHDALKPEVVLDIRGRDTSHPAPTWPDNQLEGVLLPESIRLTDPTIGPNLQATLQGMHIRTAGDLRRMKFRYFLQPEAGLTPRFKLMTPVMQFMIKHKLQFRDLSPFMAFKTPVEDHPLLMNSTRHLLMNEGVFWIELIAFLTKGDLQGIDYLGPKSYNSIIAALAKLDLELQGGH